MQFLVRYVPAGAPAVREETLDARSADELRGRLQLAGGVVLQVQARTAPAKLAGSLPKGARLDVAWWCRELETLLRAGMTAVEALETLAAGRHDGERDRVHAALLRSLREGAALSRAMRVVGVFPEVLVAGVTASERTSTLADALRDYLRYDDLLQRLRRQAVSAALYPAMVIALGTLISLFLLLYVIPRFSRMYGDMAGVLSPSTKAVMWLSRTLSEQTPTLLMLAVALVGALVLAWRGGHVTRIATGLLDQIGPLRRQWDHFRLAKLYQSLALMFRGGYTFDEALDVCTGLDLGRRLGAGINLAREQVARGKPASIAMAAAGLTEITSERLLAVGERTGSFEAVLQTIADRHAQVFTTFVERATRIVEPVLLLAVALVVGGLVVMMYMPIFDIAGGLGARR
jgi:general secretion pathway protein F